MIVYFSGSGNSLAVARRLAELTNDRLIHLNKAATTNLTNEKRIGLVYPAYSYDAPLVVKDLLPKLHINGLAYVYIVVTCGSTPGNAIPTVIGLLRKLGVEVKYSRIISVPDSSAICFGNNANEQFGKFDTVPTVLETISHNVMEEKQSLEYDTKTFPARFVNSRLFFPIATWLVKQNVNMEKCIGCGICAKVCPCQNITIEDKQAHVRNHCTQCLACVHFCPQQAVEVRNKHTVNILQYHHPDIRVNDMMGLGKEWK